MALKNRIKGLQYIRAGDLLVNPRNWRTHPPPQQAALQVVLEEVGIAGALFARETADGDPDQEWPVLVLDVDEAEADKLLATLDPLAARAGADAWVLDELLKSIETDSGDLQKMLDDLAKDNPLPTPEIVEDEVPEPPANPITQPGDLWVLGDHRLLCGDSTKAEDVDRLLDGREPFIMVTDPPYGVEYDANWRNEADLANGKPYGARAVGRVTNDDRSDWQESYELFPGEVGYVWHPPGATQFEFFRSITAAGYEVRMQIIWAKQQFPIGRGHYHLKHEPCYYFVRKTKAAGGAKWNGSRTETTLWEIDKPVKSETGHSTQKPVECMARPIRNHGGKNDDVYDPFLGSGTTLIAAEQLGRRCYGLEISPAYCDVIVQRWENLTGKTATQQALEVIV